MKRMERSYASRVENRLEISRDLRLLQNTRTRRRRQIIMRNGRSGAERSGVE